MSKRALVILAFLIGTVPCYGQGYNQLPEEQQMENMLEKLDQPGTWKNVPGPKMPVESQSPPAAFNNNGGAPMPQGQAFQAPAASPLQLNTGLPQKQGLFSGFAPKPQPPAGKSPFNVSGGDVFRMFFGGSPQGASPSSNAQAQKNAQNAQNQQKLYSAREYLQTANDQAQRARDAYASSMSGDKWSRTNNADTAYYAAQAARGAADSATAAAAGGTSDAQDAAAQARNAADEAQANADRARANADSYNPSSNSGW